MSEGQKEKALRIILGDQLFPRAVYDSAVPVYMAEDYGLCTHYKYHKHKLILFLAAMRTYAAELRSHDFRIAYQTLNKGNTEASYEEKLKTYVDEHKVEKLRVFEVEDSFMRKRLKEFCQENDLELAVEESPGSLTSRQAFKSYLDEVKSPFMKTFYERQRSRLNILIDDGEPSGGRFSFDEENRKKLPEKVVPPELPEEESSEILEAVEKLVDELFPDHPGSVHGFWLPVSRSRALHWLRDFFDERFAEFGPYEDAITDRSDTVFHSVLSPLINLGLLLPAEVIERAIEYAEENGIPLNSLEGFVRQIIGWREFVRGIYQHYEKKLSSSNFWGHENKLSELWYRAETGVPPLDDALAKAVRKGWNHHIERLMLISNTMLLCEIHPKEVYRWFMEMYVDSADWVMVPNVYGMGQYSDGGIFATKPYVCGSNYMLKMSSYSKGDWCETVDGLYWRFIEKNRDFYESNARMKMMASMVDRIDEERKSRIYSAAETFIAKVIA